MSGEGMMVTKPTTGEPFFIEDIKVYVPHREAVFIPAEKVLASRDLHRAIATKAVFTLTSTMLPAGMPVVKVDPKPIPSDKARLEALERENQALRARLADSTQIQSLEQKLQAVLEAVGRIESAKPTVVIGGPGATAHVPSVFGPINEAVGGDVPMFIPDNLAPADVNMNVEVKQQVTESGSVAGAASKLRQLRKGKPEDK